MKAGLPRSAVYKTRVPTCTAAAVHAGQGTDGWPAECCPHQSQSGDLPYTMSATSKWPNTRSASSKSSKSLVCRSLQACGAWRALVQLKQS